MAWCGRANIWLWWFMVLIGADSLLPPKDAVGMHGKPAPLKAAKQNGLHPRNSAGSSSANLWCRGEEAMQRCHSNDIILESVVDSAEGGASRVAPAPALWRLPPGI